MHEYEGKLPRWQAEERARAERCLRHREETMEETMEEKTQRWARRKDAAA